MTEEMVVVLISSASRLGEYAVKRREMFAVRDPDKIIASMVLAVTSQSHPGCYDVVVVVSPALSVEGKAVLLVQEDDITFRNIVLPDDPSDSIIIGAAVGDETTRMLWEACRMGEPTELMKESLFC